MNHKLTIIITSSLLLISLLVQLLLCATNLLDNVFIGIITSSFVVLMIEGVTCIHNRKKYRYLQGNYERTKIEDGQTQRTSEDRVYEDMTETYKKEKVEPEIRLNYDGGSQYSGEINYQEGKAKFVFNLDPINPLVGVGCYQYIEKKEGFKMPDMGSYKIQVDSISKGKLFVFHENLLPSGVEYGYEIWEKRINK